MSAPYSSVMNATKTFESRLDTAFFSHFSAIYLTAKFLFFVSALVLLRRKERMQEATGKAVYALMLISGMLIAIAGWHGLAGGLLYKLMLVVSLATSVTSAVVEAGVYGIAASFPPHIIQALFVGGAGAGSLSSLVSFLLTYNFELDTDDAMFTWCNFGIAFAVVSAAVVCWSKCTRTPYFRYYYQVHTESITRSADSSNDDDDGDDNSDNNDGRQTYANTRPPSKLIDVVLKVGDLVLFIFISNITSMIIWPFIPANTLSVAFGEPDAQWWQGRMFRPLAFLTMAIGSLIGKLIPSVPGMYRPHLPFVSLAIAKSLLVLVYMMGNVRLKGRKMLIRPLLANDALYFVLTAVSSIAGGYLGTMASMSAPDRVPPADRTTATRIIIFFGHYGDLVGTLFSTIVAVLMKTVLSVPLVDQDP